HEQALARSGGGERVERVVPVGERTLAEGPQPFAHDVRGRVREQPQLVAGGPPCSGMEHGPPASRELLEQRGLAHPAPSPHEAEPGPGLVPPPLEGRKLACSVHEQATDVTYIKRNLQPMSVTSTVSYGTPRRACRTRPPRPSGSSSQPQAGVATPHRSPPPERAPAPGSLGRAG